VDPRETVAESHHRGAAEPTVTVIVVAHDEEHRIGSRLDNLLSLDYPREKLEILLASDGSTDGTVERARRYEEAGVQVRAFAKRRGKPAVLNDVVPSRAARLSCWPTRASASSAAPSVPWLRTLRIRRSAVSAGS
jgi:cellulose synthase/poly-beta-1,6-N-acetylglucosamine synthase-like glycosyltransferase